MADFCLECTLDVFPELAGTGLNDLAGLCEPGHKAWAVCEGCGAGWFDHTGQRVVALKVPAAPPGNIYSGERSPRTVLTNPTELARKKGNLQHSYPVEIEGVVYADAEEAYQRLKRKLGHFAGMPEREALCARVVEAKLWQHPRIALFISHNDGVQWLAQCRHFTGAKTQAFSEWEGQGHESAFIRALIKAYRCVEEAGGVPISAGVLGETYGRYDRILAFGLGPLSWLGVAVHRRVHREGPKKPPVCKRNVRRQGRLPRCHSAVAPDGAEPIKPAVSRRILRVPALTDAGASLAPKTRRHWNVP